MNHFFRIVAAGAGEHRHRAFRLVDQDFDDADALLVGERRVFAGCTAWTEKMNAGVDLTTRESADRCFVERAGLRERRDECSTDARKCSSHNDPPSPSTSFIVNQPRLPTTHFAAPSAPRAKAVRSRAVCVSVTVSAGPSKPTVCVPGMNPAREEDTSMPRG